jgi:hypothetical protein
VGAATASIGNILADASVSSTSGSATTNITIDDITLDATGNTATASIDNISALADVTYSSAAATATIDIGNINIDALGNTATASIGNIIALANASTSATATATANIDIGDIELTAQGNISADATLLIGAGAIDSADANITIGNITLSAEDLLAGTDASVILGVVASANSESSSAVINLGDISLISDGNANLTLETNEYASIDVGNITMEVDVLGHITLGNGSNDSATSIDFDNLIGNVEAGGDLIVNIDNVAWNSDATGQNADFNGAGDVIINTDIHAFGNVDIPDMVFTMIDLSNHSGNIHINFGDVGSSGTASDIDVGITGTTTESWAGNQQYTTIIDFGLDDTISFAGFESASDYIEGGATYANANTLWSDLNILLNGAEEYAFAIFDETLGSASEGDDVDLNGDGETSGTIGVLAYDPDSSGITSLVFLVDSGVDSITYASFADTNIDYYT